MTYEAVIELLQNQKETLVDTIAQELAKSNLLPPHFTSEGFYKVARLPLELIIGYLQSGDLTDWKAYVKSNTDRVISRNLNTAEGYQAVGDISLDGRAQLVE